MENWYFQAGEASDVVLSTRVRLARNLRSIPFSLKETNADAQKLYEKIKEILPSVGFDLNLLKLADMDEVTILSLVEKHLITPEFGKTKNPYAAIAMNPEENLCILIGEEDHIKIQAFAAGFALEEAANRAISVDEKLNELLDYACDEQFGYLTSNPSHVGTGMKASVIVHLPGLTKSGNMSSMLRVINNFGMTVQNCYGEGSEYYQITSNQSLGITEKNIIKNSKAITERVMEQERVARKYLTKREMELKDKIYRSFGTFVYAKTMTAQEAGSLLSEIKLGVDLGILDELTDKQIRKLQVNLKPGNLQKFLGEKLDIRARDYKRPEVIEKIRNEKE